MKKLLFYLIVLFGVISCEELIEVVDISNTTVQVLAPKNETVLQAGDIVFNWENVEDAESYKLQIATPNFAEANQIIADSILNATSFNIALENNNYEWRIRAENSGYNTDYSTQSFTIEE